MVKPVDAQILYGGIVGNVTDASDAAIPRATVTIINNQTNATRSAVTSETGAYSFPTVATGTYTLRVSSEGFRAYTETNVTVSVNTVTRANVRMELGQVTEQITVEASALRLQTDRAEVRAEVGEKELKNLPVPLGRNYQMLIRTLPGVSVARNAHSVPSNPSRAVRFSVNGTSESNNNTRIDGASSTNVWLPHMTAYAPALEAIETVNIVTNSFDAEQGLAGGAAINVQIKSGTNDLHGSAFWYNNNHRFNAWPYFGSRAGNQPKYLYNQMGGTVGGPIKRDKVFFFLSYEGTRERQFAERLVDVPTAAMRQGDLSISNTTIYDPMTGQPGGMGRQPFPNNIIPQNRISRTAQIINADPRWPLPNRVGDGFANMTLNHVASGGTLFDRDTIDSKVNFNHNERWTSFLRLSFLDYRMDNDTVFAEFGGRELHPTNSNMGTGYGTSYSGTVSTTYVATPTFVVDGYFGYTLMDTNVEQRLLDENIGRDFLMIPGTNGTRRFEGGWPRIQIAGFEQLGITNNFMPYYRTDPQWQYVANGNWTKGRHEVRFGTDYYIQHLNHNQPEFPASTGPAQGGLSFNQGVTQLVNPNGSVTVGSDFNSFASYLLGLANSGGKIIQYPEEYRTRTQMFSLYVRDRWQVTPKLTMSYGTRWEYYPYPERDNRGLERYNFDTNEMMVCGVGSSPRNCGVNASRRMFAPRLGFAYRATDTFVIRAGYGITIDPFNWARPLRTNYPIMFVQNLVAESARDWATTFDLGIPPVPPPPDGSPIPMPLTAAAVVVDQQARRGYIQSWNYTMEKQLAGGWLVSAGYVATRSVAPLNSINANWSDIGTGSAGQQLRIRHGRTGNTNYHGILGTAKYDSLQTRAQRRFANDFQMNVSYTWGKSLGYSTEETGAGLTVHHPLYFDKNYGPTPQDRSHNVQLSGLWELPFGRGKRWATGGVGSAIAGGWQINGIFSGYTGRPVRPAASGASLNSTGSSQFADCLGPVSKIGQRTAWYDRANLAPVTEPRFGTCGNNSLRGPGLINADMGVFRRFPITERVNLEFRAEAFNISNTPHFSTPNADITSNNFGVITGVENRGVEGLDQRVFRLGLRFAW